VGTVLGQLTLGQPVELLKRGTVQRFDRSLQARSTSNGKMRGAKCVDAAEVAAGAVNPHPHY
jgi:hypothetical protein